MLLIISLILDISLIEAEEKGHVLKAEASQGNPFNLRGNIEMYFVKDLLKGLILQTPF